MEYRYVYSKDGNFCIRLDAIKTGNIVHRLPDTNEPQESYIFYVRDFSNNDYIMGRFDNIETAKGILNKVLP